MSWRTAAPAVGVAPAAVASGSSPAARAAPPGDRAGDAGAATVLVLALSCVVVLLGMVGVALVGVATARHRAASTADLAALAAARHALEGGGAACGRADGVAAASAARLTSCVLAGDTVSVQVAVRPPGPLGGLGEAVGRARAGPATLLPTP